MKKAFGSMAKKAYQRMKEIEASENLDILMRIPAANCHELSGDRKEQFAVDISGNYRLIFVPDHDPVPRTADGNLDAIRIVEIKMLGKEDYH